MPTTISVSDNYKNAQKKSILWISLFILTFVFSLILSLALFALALYISFNLVSENINTATIAISIGICLMGGMITFFNFKYLFSILKKTNEEGKEIFAKDYPELFSLINETADEVGTKRPKKVFLIQDINASVYYSNHIQSLLLPTPKNLNIGVGLLQMTSINELKGIIAHEFGHFSQKSMSIGSYTANAYYVIDEIVNNKESMTDLIDTIANFNAIISIISRGALLYNKLFEKIYTMIFNQLNFHRLALSREMEYHADQIATHVVGIETMIKPMLRMDLYISILQNMSSFYYSKSEEKLYSENYYQNLDQLVEWHSKNNQIIYEKGLPQPTINQLFKNNSSIHLENIYSTHPDLIDSIENIENTGIQSKIDNSPLSKTLIKDIEKYELDFTFDYFFSLDITRKNCLTNEEFMQLYKLENTINIFPEEYHGLFSESIVNYTEILAIETPNSFIKLDSKDIFSTEITQLYEKLFGYKKDLELLEVIKNNKQIKTFKFENILYRKQDIDIIFDKIINNQKPIYLDVLEHEEKVNLFFAQNLTEENRSIAELGIEINEDYNKIIDLTNTIHEKGQFMFKHNHEKIIQEGIQFLHETNIAIKKFLNEYLANEYINGYFKLNHLNNLSNYLKNDQEFYNGDYLEYEITEYYETLKFIQDANQIINFELKKKFLISFIKADIISSN